MNATRLVTTVTLPADDAAAIGAAGRTDAAIPSSGDDPADGSGRVPTATVLDSETEHRRGVRPE